MIGAVGLSTQTSRNLLRLFTSLNSDTNENYRTKATNGGIYARKERAGDIVHIKQVQPRNSLVRLRVRQ